MYNMPLYKCESCNYSSNIKSHYNKHLKTNKHLLMIQNAGVKKNNIIECDICNKIFSSKNSMYRHKKHYCKVKNNIDLKKEDANLYKKLKEENRDLKEKLNNKHKEYKKYIDFKNEEIRDKNIIIQDLMKVNKEQRQRIMDLEINRKILNKKMENPSGILNQIF